MNFILAQDKDLEAIWAMFQAATNEMNKNAIYQWDEIYPNKIVLKEDIEKEQLYVGISEDIIACAYVINKECDEQYTNGRWEYPDENYCVIHRLCVNPVFQNKAIGTLTMKHIEQEIQQNGISCIRLDAFTLNPYAVKMYEKLGYVKVGVANWRKGQFYLMEKKL